MFSRSCIHSFVHLFIPFFVRSFVHYFLRSFIYSFIHSFVRSFIPSFVHSFLRSFIRSLLCSFIRCLTFREESSHLEVTGGESYDRCFVQLIRDGGRKRKEFCQFVEFCVFLLSSCSCGVLRLLLHFSRFQFSPLEIFI